MQYSVLFFCLCRTVEVNNTDAEGRLVLGDGVSRCVIYPFSCTPLLPLSPPRPPYHPIQPSTTPHLLPKPLPTLVPFLHIEDIFDNDVFSFGKVAYACRDLKADVIVDLATLTGAQGLATGKEERREGGGRGGGRKKRRRKRKEDGGKRRRKRREEGRRRREEEGKEGGGWGKNEGGEKGGGGGRKEVEKGREGGGRRRRREEKEGGGGGGGVGTREEDE